MMSNGALLGSRLRFVFVLIAVTACTARAQTLPPISVQFVSHGMHPTPTEITHGDFSKEPTPGHIFMIISIPTLHGPKEEAFGFYPKDQSLSGVIKGPGLAKSEFRCGTNDDCSPARYQKSLHTMSESDNSVRIYITEQERRKIIEDVETWNHKEYRLTTQNCIDFVSSVVKDLGYPSPDRHQFQTPDKYLAALKTNVVAENKRRETVRATEEAPRIHAPEHWQTVEGEIPGHYRNEWHVRYDGEEFSCAPSPAFAARCRANASGDTRTVNRFWSSDNNPCTFTGTASGNVISGTYSCTGKFKGPYPWQATIVD